MLENEGATDATDMKYDPSSAFALCCGSLAPIARLKDATKCPYCDSLYQGDFEEKLCATCELAKIGAPATGLKIFPDD